MGNLTVRRRDCAPGLALVILCTIITLFVLIHDPTGLPHLSPWRRALLSHLLGLQRRNLLIEAFSR